MYVSFFINTLHILALLRQHARRRSSVHTNHEHVLVATKTNTHPVRILLH